MSSTNHATRNTQYASRRTRHSSLISVVIPVYNGGEDFQRCLDALRACEPPLHEIIVVDDGSSDESPRLARDRGLTVLSTARARSGPAIARNIGVKAASGDIMLFIDADVAVHPDVIGRFAHNFESAPDLAACFGSYDEQPAAKNFLSQYKNLFHHVVHQSAQADASTFWAGCGAIRRDLFLKVGGFSENYPRPSIEDIELGYRLKAAGCKLQLDKEIQCQHLKRWTWRSLIRSDILDRGVPWTELILRDGAFVNDLNLQTHNRISVALIYLWLFTLALGLVAPLGWLASAGLAISLLWLNRNVYTFFKTRRGNFFALRAIPVHWLYYFYNGLSFSIGAARHIFRSDRAAPNRSAWSQRVMIGVVLIGAALRFINLGRASFWYDELLQANIAAHDLPTILSKMFENAAMPLDYFSTHVMLIFGQSEFWLRFPAAMWGVLTLPLIYQIGRRLFDRTIGVTAAGLLAVIGVHAFYSQELRPYALLVFLATLSFYFLIRILHTGRTRYWVAYSLTIGLAVLTHHFMLFLISAQGLIILIVGLSDRTLRRDRTIGAQRAAILKFAAALIPVMIVLIWTSWFGSILAVGRLFIESIVAPHATSGSALPGPVLGEVPRLKWSFFYDKILVNFTGGEPILPYTFLILWAAGAWLGLHRARRSTVLLLVWAMVPTALVLVLLRQSNAFFAIRYILYTLPAFILLIAFSLISGLRAIYRSHPKLLHSKLLRFMQFVIPIGLIILAGNFSNASLAYLSGPSEHWREAGQFLIDNVRSGDLLVLPQASALIEFYTPALPVSLTLSNLPQDLPKPLPQQRMWLLLNMYNYPPGMYEAWGLGRPHVEYRLDAALQVELITTADNQLEVLREAADVRVPALPAMWAGLALQNESIGNLDIAFDQMQHALALSPDRTELPNLLLQQADMFRRAQRWAAASAGYQQVLNIDAHRIMALVGLGRVYLAQNQIEAARAQFNQALAIDPNSYEANLFMAQSYTRTGDQSQAAAFYAAAEKINGDMPTPP
jgi:glycosyltransferase involved in cell wall biosynthesis